MMTLLRRVLVTALVTLLAGLGVVAALLGRRQRRRGGEEVEVLVPVAIRQPIARPSAQPATRPSGGWRRSAVALVVLLLMVGLIGAIYESRAMLFGLATHVPEGDARALAGRPRADKPLTALSQPEAGANALPAPGTKAQDTKASAASVASSGPGGTPTPTSIPPATTAPGFDVVRIEPNGDAVVAGQAAPNAIVDLLVDGKPVASAKANGDGRFTFLPPTLPTGHSEIGLRATSPQGGTQRSAANVAVVVSPSRDAKPLVAVTSPDKPTVVLSQPDHPIAVPPGSEPGRLALRTDADTSQEQDRTSVARHAPQQSGGPKGSEAGAEGRDEPASNRGETTPPAGRATSVESPHTTERPAAIAAPPQVVSIDARNGGGLFVTAHAASGADLRLYLNDTLIAPATVGRDGTVTFGIGHGVVPGNYKVRLDLVDPVTGKVRGRAEVPFSAPAPGQDTGVEVSATRQDPGREPAGRDVSPRRTADSPQPSSTGSLAANGAAETAAGPSEVYVPGIETTRIVRGDNLWTISRRIYGEGERYTLIYDANQDQIRDPDLIYPGQVFVLPNRGTAGADADGNRP